MRVEIMIAEAERSVSRGWSPLLSGDRQEDARAAAAAIAADMDGWPYPCSPSASPEAPGGAWSLGLPAGRAGRALFYAYLARTEHPPQPRWSSLARQLLDEALAGLPPPAEGCGLEGCGLYFGFPGIAWTVAHLAADLPPGERAADLLERADQRLGALVARETWLGLYDLTAGLVGVGLYFLERLPARRAAAAIEDVLRLLAGSAHHSAAGAAWFTPPHLLADDERALVPQGCYKVATAHGALGIVSLLARACAAGFGGAAARGLLHEAVRWLLTQAAAGEGPSRFPCLVGADGVAAPARMPWSWCQGDLGAAASLLNVAGCQGNRRLADAAVDVALRLAPCLDATEGPPSPGLCHGTAGLAHLFNRMYQATNHPQLGRAAVYWLERTLAACRPGRGIGGFSSPIWQLESDGHAVLREDAGLLNGAAGIGLSLLAASSACEPEWDRILLVSPGPLGARAEREERP